MEQNKVVINYSYLRYRVNRLSNANCMYNKVQTLTESYQQLLEEIGQARLKRHVKESFYNMAFAIKCNASDELYNQLKQIEDEYFK